jgi:hypothetical protein
MAPEDEAALEVEEEVLADGLDALEPASVESIGETLHRGARVRRLDFDPLAHERLKLARGAVDGVAFGHERRLAPSVHDYGSAVTERARAACAGAAAATVWALLEPVDRRLFRSDYSDVAMLGKLVTRGPGWRVAGLTIHAANGAAFGLAFHELRRRLGGDPRRLALALALIENVALYPLAAFVDRHHPARGEPGLAPLLTVRAFAQETARHAVFGVVLGLLAGKRA